MTPLDATAADTPLKVGSHEFHSRLLVGTGKYPSLEIMQRAHEASGTELVTVAVRRIHLDDPSGKTLIEEDVHASPEYVGFYEETRSRMCIPLVSFGQTLGVLMLESEELASFHQDDVESLEAVADICATAIQNAHYVERVKQLAYLDGLTGIFNRRYFEMRVVEEIDRARRFNSGMAVVMIDIDQFKRLNDEFGHLLGDEVLRQVSSMFHQQVDLR